MLLFDLKKHGDHQRNYKLKDEVNVSKPIGEVITVTDGIKEILHIIVKVNGGEDYEGE